MNKKNVHNAEFKIREVVLVSCRFVAEGGPGTNIVFMRGERKAISLGVRHVSVPEKVLRTISKSKERYSSGYEVYRKVCMYTYTYV